MSDNIRPEVKALIERGNVTLAEWQAFRGNSWEQEAMLPALSNEALIHHARHMAENCRADPRRPSITYNDAVPVVLVPELLRRLEALSTVTVQPDRGCGVTSVPYTGPAVEGPLSVPAPRPSRPMPTALHLTARFLNLRYVGSNAHPFHFEGQDRMLDLNVCQPRPPNAGGMHSISITESTEDGPNGVEVPIVFECATCNRLSELFRNNNPAFHEALAAIK